MKYPEFYDDIEVIKLKDPLADFLGAFEDGLYNISYLEIVKASGHSCPTVAGAYIMTKEAIKYLYSDGIAIRGDIKVEFKDDIRDGVTGVISNVVSHITGATNLSGFKGLNGNFVRHSLLSFNSNTTASTRFTSISNGKSVEIFYDHSKIPANPNMMKLMQKINNHNHTQEELKDFKRLWQNRVEMIFNNIDKVIEIK